MAVRINAFLRNKGYASRREADRLIADGKVLVNGKRAEPGMTISDADEVTVRGEQKKHTYLAYFKPRGLATQAIQGTDDVISRWKPKGLFPVGRLDKESEGLLILTDDGRLTTAFNRGVEKEYLVRVREELTPRILAILAKGMDTKTFGKLLPAKTKMEGPYTVRITLREGKRHQIRVMLDELHYTVVSLKRIRVGPVKLRDLKPDTTRPLLATELAELGMLQ